MSSHSILKIKTKDFNFKDTIFSHGWVFLRPFKWDDNKSELHFKLKVKDGELLNLKVGHRNEHLRIIGSSENGLLKIDQKNELKKIVRHILRLDEDLSGFYEVCRKDPQLKFVDKLLQCLSLFIYRLLLFHLLNHLF